MSSHKPTKQCVARLMKEQRTLAQTPSALFAAGPEPENILRWYFVVDGPADTDYAGGRYLGQLKFPPEYPFKPPAIMMHTPNGRFTTDTPLCLSNSSFHPEQWSPMWGVETIVTGFISFLTSDDATTGSVDSSPAHRRQLAKESRAFNVTRLQHIYSKAIPAEYAKDLEIVERERAGGSAAGADATAAAAPAAAPAATKSAATNDASAGGKDAKEAPATPTAAAPAEKTTTSTGETVSKKATVAETADAKEEEEKAAAAEAAPRAPAAAAAPAPAPAAPNSANTNNSDGSKKAEGVPPAPHRSNGMGAQHIKAAVVLLLIAISAYYALF